VLDWLAVGTETISLGEEVVSGDLACSRCGYNLRTMPAGGVCPECGQPVPTAVEYDRAYRDRRHVNAGPGYGRWMRRLSHAMLLAAAAAAVAVFVPYNSRRSLGVEDVAAAAVVWTLGCWALWAAGAPPGPALPAAQRRRTAPLRAVMRLAAVTALAWPVVLEAGDRIVPIDPDARRLRAIAGTMSGAAGMGSTAFFLYVAILARQTFRRALRVEALVLAAAAVVVTLACATGRWPYDLPAGAAGFTAWFGHHYLPVAGPVRSGLLSAGDVGDWHSDWLPAHLAAVVMLWSVPFLIWSAFAFAWTARCYELHELAGFVTPTAAATGGRTETSCRP